MATSMQLRHRPRVYAMIRLDLSGRIVQRMIAGAHARAMLSGDWITDYEVTNEGEPVTCEHGHPNCGMGSTLCGDEHE
jgi:hypothetical protein